MLRRPLAGRQTREPGGGLANLLIGVPLFGVLVARSPLIAGAVLATFTAAVVAVTSPGGLIAIAAVLSTAIPKAGVVISGFPVPVVMFVLLLAALQLRFRNHDETIPRRGTRLAALALAWLVYRLIALRLDGGGLGDVLALAAWFGLPLVLLLVGPPIGSLRGETARTWVSRLEVGLLIACVFSLVQQAWGIEATSVPGVTRAVGADYSAKPLQFLGGTKIPSTYQNGNILGVITGFFFLIAADRALRGYGRARDRLIMAATAVASVLSGSRTVLIGLGLGLLVLILRSGLSRRAIAVSLLAASALVAALQVSPALSDRLTGTRASDPGLAVRSEVWERVLESTSVGELLVGGPVWPQRRLDPGLAEGLIGVVQQVGIIGMVLFLGVFWIATSAPELRRWRLVLIPVAVSLAVDSAYLVFPTLFVPLARMYAPLQGVEGPASEEEADAPPERVAPAPV